MPPHPDSSPQKHDGNRRQGLSRPLETWPRRRARIRPPAAHALADASRTRPPDLMSQAGVRGPRRTGNISPSNRVLPWKRGQAPWLHPAEIEQADSSAPVRERQHRMSRAGFVHGVANVFEGLQTRGVDCRHVLRRRSGWGASLKAIDDFLDLVGAPNRNGRGWRKMSRIGISLCCRMCTWPSRRYSSVTCETVVFAVTLRICNTRAARIIPASTATVKIQRIR